MATYYVRPDGNDGNAGTGSATNQAWRTIQKALGATGIGSGDTVYIAPGLYGEQVTIGGTYSATTYITGDPTASQFSGVSAGRVQIGAFTNLANAPIYTGNTISGTSKNNLYFSSIEFLLSCGTFLASYGISLQTSQNNTFDKCVFQQTNNAAAHILNVSPPTSSALNLTVKNCVFIGSTVSAVGYLVVIFGQNAVSDTTSFTNTIFQNHNTGMYLDSITMSITNCNFIGLATGLTQLGSRIITLKNSLFYGCSTGAACAATSTQTFCRYVGCGVSFSGASASATSSTVGTSGVENYYTLMNGLANLQPESSIFGSPNTAFGTASGAPVADLYGVTWTGATPDAGAATFRSLSTIGSYLPTERNASTITIAPASTSQSIELYLGATGLTFATSGLAAYYIRNQSAPVAITLVTQTPTGAWASGGFAEISSSLVPGVYRLDVPNAAFAAGASDVTVVVRGASGTNGAVLTVTLSSGGLTAAQTAAAVLDAVGSSYVTAGSIGHAIQNNNVTAIVGSTAAASELSGALLHNGTDYIDSNLLGGASTRVFVGRFDLRQTGSDDVDTIEVFTTDTPSFELQLTDGDGNEVPVTGATLGLRILDVASTVVETGTPTVEYGTGGIVRWTGPGTYLAIGCPVGMYRLFIDRTVSGTTTTFGPLQIKVQAQ
jgi:hypothetical protein